MNDDNKIIAHPPTVSLFGLVFYHLFSVAKLTSLQASIVNGQEFDVDIHMNIQSCQIISMVYPYLI